MNVKKMKNDDDSSTDDLTKDMEEPVPEPNVQEINITKLGMHANILLKNTKNDGVSIKCFQRSSLVDDSFLV